MLPFATPSGDPRSSSAPGRGGCIVDQRTSVRVSLRLCQQVCACSQKGRQNTYSPHNIMSYFIVNRCAAHFFFILLVAPPM
jgi:hypothetical protein